jgi:heme/copper-type cytochrome/quinol oxidase subunit 4
MIPVTTEWKLKEMTLEPLPEEQNVPAEGIGGWLLLPLLMLIGMPLYIGWLTMTRLNAHTPMADLHGMAGHPVFIALTGFILAAVAVKLMLGLYCLVQLLRKKESVPRLARMWFGLAIALCVLVPVLYALDRELYSTVIDPDVAPSVRDAALNIFWNGLWLLYFELSKRVKNTFVN